MTLAFARRPANSPTADRRVKRERAPGAAAASVSFHCGRQIQLLSVVEV